MGLEAVTFPNDLNTSNPIATDPRSEGDDHLRNLKVAIKNAFPGIAGRTWRVQSKATGYTAIATDNMSVIRCTAAFTLVLTAAATLGNGFLVLVDASSGDITIDPAGAELVNDVATVVVRSGSRAVIWCDGTSFYAATLPVINGVLEVGNLTVTGSVIQNSILSPAQIIASQNNYNPSGLSTAVHVRVNSDARRSITGLAGGVSGRKIKLYNVGTFPILLKREDALSTAANRFAFGSTLGGGQTVEIEYDGTSTRWRALAIPEPIGTIKEFGGGTIPEDFLDCDASEKSRTTNAILFNEIGTTWGAGDGSTTFNLPPPGRVPVGAGTGTSVVSGVDADVDITANTLAVPSNTRKWITGMKINFTLASGTITGLVGGTDYYVVRASDIAVRLATTLANAQNGTTIDFTAKSSPVWTLTHTYEARTLGEVGGEEGHAMSSTEELAHDHGTHVHREQGVASNSATPIAATVDAADVAGNTANPLTINSHNVQFNPAALNTLSATVPATGGNTAANIMQPYMVVKRIIRAF